MLRRQAKEFSGYEFILTPKPPPMSMTITRTLFSGTPMMLEMKVLSRWGLCVPTQRVILPSARS